MAPLGWHLGHSYQPLPFPGLCRVPWGPNPAMTHREEKWRIHGENCQLGRCPTGTCYKGPSDKKGVISLLLKGCSTEGRQLSMCGGLSLHPLSVGLRTTLRKSYPLQVHRGTEQQWYYSRKYSSWRKEGLQVPSVPGKLGEWKGPEPLTASVSQDNLALTGDPAVAGELDVISTGRLQRDVLQEPVVMQPVLALLDFDQLDLAQLFVHCHIIRINLRGEKGKSGCLGDS